MGSSSECNKSIDTSVGSLVWVRRRNGKWWPGRILGPEELPESCLPSARTGAHVKLLGKEGASVDWYNFEKSARVKAFRCGEYDECIEKAKAAAASSSKKYVKCARREDAILHALEIESTNLGKDHPDYYSGIEKQEGEHLLEDSPSSFHPHEEETDHMEQDSRNHEDDSHSAPELSEPGVQFEDSNHTGASREPSVRRTPIDSEDDGTVVQRMKGLDDLGMGGVSSLKRKRSLVAHVHEFLKRKHRRRTLAKVLESSAMVTVPIMCQQLANPTGSLLPGASTRKIPVSGSDESKKTFSLKENGISCMFPEIGSNVLYDVPFVAEENWLAGTAEIHDVFQTVDNGTSKWKSKGKRSRHTSKNRRQETGRFMDADDACDAYLAGLERGADCNTYKGSLPSENGKYHLKSKAVAEFQVDEYRGWSTDISNKDSNFSGAIAELPTPQRLLPYRQSRFSVNPKYHDFSLRHHTAESSLVDVNLEVKASNRPQHVPYVSLMSKLSDRPIIGHPLTVEVLDDGFCNNLMSSSECYSSSCEFSEDLRENNFASGRVELDCEARSNSFRRTSIMHKSQQCLSPTKSPRSRRNGFLSKKTRTLSSLTGAHRQSDEEKKLVVEKLKGPAIACIPLTVVFSRINEALNSSTRSAHCP